MKLPIAARPQVISRFWAVIRRFPKLIAAVLVFQVVASLIVVATPWLIGRLLDLIVAGTTRAEVTRYLIIIGVLVAAQLLLTYLGE